MKTMKNICWAPVLCCLLSGPAAAQTFTASGKATVSDAFFANTNAWMHGDVWNAWMHGDVWNAWTQGYKGQGVKITVVDNYSGNPLNGSLNGVSDVLSHGEFVLKTAGIVAREAELRPVDFSYSTNQPLRLVAGGMNVINASYAILSSSAATAEQALSIRERSIIQHARNGAAVVVMAAGNYQSGGFTVTTGKQNGKYLAMSSGLFNAQSAIFVGALDRNGSPENKARLASYSNYAGANTDYQKQFLVVGVDEANMGGLRGTSFAAPIVSGYAAIVGSKFHVSPAKVVNQLLVTARKDTIEDYRADVHGQGEASLSRALAPKSIR